MANKRNLSTLNELNFFIEELRVANIEVPTNIALVLSKQEATEMEREFCLPKFKVPKINSNKPPALGYYGTVNFETADIALVILKNGTDGN